MTIQLKDEYSFAAIFQNGITEVTTAEVEDDSWESMGESPICLVNQSGEVIPANGVRYGDLDLQAIANQLKGKVTMWDGKCYLSSLKTANIPGFGQAQGTHYVYPQ